MIISLTRSVKMATYVEILENSKNIKLHIFQKYREAQLHRNREYSAAVVIQSWFRGVRIRAYLKILSEKCIVIQKHWRGFLGRRIYRMHLKEAVIKKTMNFYNMKTTQIQKIWRGWYVRKKVFDYSVWKRYLSYVENVNTVISKQVSDYWNDVSNPAAAMNQHQLKILRYQGRKKHYLLSTKVAAGIYNQPHRPDLMQIENWIERNKAIIPVNSTSCGGPPATYPPMPPNKKKPQGPFLTPKEVHRLKHQPIKITLRMLNIEQSGKRCDWVLQKKASKHPEFNHLLRLPKVEFPTSIIHGRREHEFRSRDPKLDVSKKEFKLPFKTVPLEKTYEKLYEKDDFTCYTKCPQKSIYQL